MREREKKGRKAARMYSYGPPCLWRAIYFGIEAIMAVSLSLSRYSFWKSSRVAALKFQYKAEEDDDTPLSLSPLLQNAFFILDIIAED